MLSTSPPSSLKSSPSPFAGRFHSGNTPSSSPESISFRPLRVSNAAAYASSPAAEETRTSSSSSSSSYLNPNGMASPSCLSLYAVLGISMGATNQEIKSAYRRLARECHPDVATFDRKDTSADAFMKIHAAYSTLSDPGKRSVYDRELFRRHRPFDSFSGVTSPSATAMSGFSGYTRRNWETDQCW